MAPGQHTDYDNYPPTQELTIDWEIETPYRTRNPTISRNILRPSAASCKSTKSSRFCRNATRSSNHLTTVNLPTKQPEKELPKMSANPENQPIQWHNFDVEVYEEESLEDWITPSHLTATRYIAPSNYERVAAANATPAFTNAIYKLTDQIESSDDTQHNKATRITASVAILANFVSSVVRRVHSENTALINDRDVPTPAIAEAFLNLESSVEATNKLAQRAQSALQELGIPLTPLQSDFQLPLDHPANLQAAEQRKLRDRAAETAFFTGNAAALKWHLEQLSQTDHEDEPMGPMAGHILAMWPAENNLMRITYSEHEDDSFHQAAGKARQEAISTLLTPDNLNIVEFARPVHVSCNISEDNDPGFLIGQSWGRGPECEAMYESPTDDLSHSIMLYRYQGCTHVKTADEPYAHPIDRQTVLSHCDDLEQLLLDLEDPEAPFRPATYRLAVTNRAKALSGLHQIPECTVYRMVQKTKRAIPEQTRQKAVVDAICDGFRDPAEQLYEYHDLNQSPLTPEQLRVAIDAARNAGASEAALRDMAIMLAVPSQDTLQYGVPSQQPVPWTHARDIIRDICMMKNNDSTSWLPASQAMGWPTDSKEVAEFAESIGATDQLMLYLNQQEAEVTDD